MKTAHRGFISTRFDRRVETELDPGPEANARLTALTSVVLTILLAAEGATLLSLRSFISWHILLGVALVPVVALKLGSTVYRFARYYTGRADYVRAARRRCRCACSGRWSSSRRSRCSGAGSC
jgi:hypothetical protein